jgi:glycosyltransferase involved in cell wall biosynthesis
MIVVASNKGGLPELVGDAGFLVEPTPQEAAGAGL